MINWKRLPHEKLCDSLFCGDDGIRTHVPGKSDKLISSQSRYGHFGTSPFHDSLYANQNVCYYTTYPKVFQIKFIKSSSIKSVRKYLFEGSFLLSKENLKKTM